MQDIYATVTEKIVAALESGTAPWVRPWQGGASASDHLPYNATTGRAYNGTNILLLWMAGQTNGYSRAAWLTYKQAAGVGGHVRKGERATPIVFAGKITRENDAGEQESFSVLRYFSVFNVDQCDGLPAHMTPAPQPIDQPAPDAHDAFIVHTGAKIEHRGARAFYAPSLDAITLPPVAAFRSKADYHATALHELAHWTGHESRLDRAYGKKFGDEAYACEELVAELSAAFSCARLGIAGKLQHAEYIASWVKLLQDHKRAIFTAAAAASKATDFLFALQPGAAA